MLHLLVHLKCFLYRLADICISIKGYLGWGGFWLCWARISSSAACLELRCPLFRFDPPNSHSQLNAPLANLCGVVLMMLVGDQSKCPLRFEMTTT